MKALLTIAGACALVLLTMRFEHFWIITTDSAAPAGIYAARPVPLKRDQLVLACLPPDRARLAFTNGYLGAGDCPENVEPVAKIVGALPGDTLDLEEHFVAINGVRLPESPTAPRDSANRPLAHAAWGRREVPAGEVWLFGFNNPRSWDARYFAGIPAANVIGRLTPIITW